MAEERDDIDHVKDDREAGNNPALSVGVIRGDAAVIERYGRHFEFLQPMVKGYDHVLVLSERNLEQIKEYLQDTIFQDRRLLTKENLPKELGRHAPEMLEQVFPDLHLSMSEKEWGSFGRILINVMNVGSPSAAAVQSNEGSSHKRIGILSLQGESHITARNLAGVIRPNEYKWQAGTPEEALHRQKDTMTVIMAHEMAHLEDATRRFGILNSSAMSKGSEAVHFRERHAMETYAEQRAYDLAPAMHAAGLIHDPDIVKEFHAGRIFDTFHEGLMTRKKSEKHPDEPEGQHDHSIGFNVGPGAYGYTAFSHGLDQIRAEAQRVTQELCKRLEAGQEAYGHQSHYDALKLLFGRVSGQKLEGERSALFCSSAIPDIYLRDARGALDFTDRFQRENLPPHSRDMFDQFRAAGQRLVHIPEPDESAGRDRELARFTRQAEQSKLEPPVSSSRPVVDILKP